MRDLRDGIDNIQRFGMTFASSDTAPSPLGTGHESQNERIGQHTADNATSPSGQASRQVSGEAFGEAFGQAFGQASKQVVGSQSPSQQEKRGFERGSY